MQSRNAVSSHDSVAHDRHNLNAVARAHFDKSPAVQVQRREDGGAAATDILGDGTLNLRWLSLAAEHFDSDFSRNRMARFLSLVRRINFRQKLSRFFLHSPEAC